MTKYILKRVLLMLFTLFVITTICFVLVKLLPPNLPEGGTAEQTKVYMDRFEALGYFEPIPVQYFIYLKNIVTKFDFGTSWFVDRPADVVDLLFSRMPPTIMVNLYSLIFSTPLGIALGIFAAIKKNKWQDHVISTLVIVCVSVPSYVYAFLVQYIFYFKLGWFPQTIYSLHDASGGWLQQALIKIQEAGIIAKLPFLADSFKYMLEQSPYFSGKMLFSMVLPVLALSFGSIAGLCRFTRAELTETLTSDYMLLARTKGLTRAQATVRHALKNAMVPILPSIISGFIGIIGGSMVIEQIFSIPGVGALYLQAITTRDYDLFMLDTIFYTFVGLLAGIVVDLSYGFIDPRIRMGEK